MPSKEKQLRAICFTLNNPEDQEAVITAIKSWEAVQYGIIGKEVGAEGTPHLQGYLKFAKVQRVKPVTDKLEELCGKRPHCEPAKGSAKHNQTYCSKEGDFVEWGAIPKQGKRTDLEKAADMLKDGRRMIEVANEVPATYIRYHRGLEKYQQLHQQEKAEEWREVEVTLHTGPTGCGKTRAAMASAERVYKIQGDQLQWWDGYEGEETIVIDEYANDVKITTLLGLLDGYKLRLPVKGGFTYACWKKVHITTNLFELHESAKQAHKEALARRIKKVISYWEHSGIDKMAKTFAADN